MKTDVNFSVVRTHSCTGYFWEHSEVRATQCLEGQTHAGSGGFHMNVNRFHPLPRIHEEQLVPSSGMESSTYR